MVKFAFTVPGKPVPKGRPRVQMRGGRPHLFTPGDTAKYERRVWAYAVTAGFTEKPWTGPVNVRIDLYYPNAIRRDVDNGAKSILDALNHRAMLDDSQVVDLHIRKFIDRTNPRAEVVIEKVAVNDAAQLEVVFEQAEQLERESEPAKDGAA